MQPRLVQVEAWPRFTGQLGGEQGGGAQGSGEAEFVLL